MSKAANGSGTIIKLPNGKWRAAIFVTFNNGKKRRMYRVFRTQKDARNWLTSVRSDIQLGKCVTDQNLTLGSWLRHWVDNYAVLSIRDSTHDNYEGYLKKIGNHTIGEVRLKDLTTDNLQNFVNFLVADGHMDSKQKLSPKTIRNMMCMIRTALKQAVGNQLIFLNPADYVKLPKVDQKEINILSEDDIARLLSVSAGEPWQIAFVLMNFCGLRIGEACALTHADIMAEDGIHYLNITKSLNRVHNYDSNDFKHKTVLKLQDTKSRKSRRKIPLLPEIYSLINKHIELQNKQQALNFGVFEENPFLISNSLGQFVDPGTVRKYMKKKADFCGLKDFHPHVCRHTFASQAIKSGVPLLAVSETLGHSSPSVSAKFYIHTDLEGQANELSHLSGLVNGVITQLNS